MKIISFDCAINTLGVCIATINPIIVNLQDLKNNFIDLSTDINNVEKINKLIKIIEIIDAQLLRFIEIEFMNTYDPERYTSDSGQQKLEFNKITTIDAKLPKSKTSKSKTSKSKTSKPKTSESKKKIIKNVPLAAKNLSFILSELDRKYNPDVMLYEYQMGPNDKSRAISHFILYHYIQKSVRVIEIGPSLKNAISFTDQLIIQNFFSKCSNNYIANKNHAKKNTSYWMDTFNVGQFLKIPKPLRVHVSDAFMQMVAFIQS